MTQEVSYIQHIAALWSWQIQQVPKVYINFAYNLCQIWHMSLAAYSQSLPSPTLTSPYFLHSLEFRCNMCSSIERISLNLLKILKNFKN